MVVGMVAVVLAGCTEQGRQDVANEVGSLADRASREASELTSRQAAPDPTEPPATEAQVTEVPEPSEPAASPVPVEEATDPIDWLPWVLLGLAVVVVWALIAGYLRRRRAARRAARERFSAAVADLVGTGRWVMDQGSTEVMRITEAGQLSRSWEMVRERMVGLEERASRLHVEGEGTPGMPAVSALGTASAALRSALDGDVAMRTDPTTADDLLAESRRTVQQRRQEFGIAVDRIAALR